MATSMLRIRPNSSALTSAVSRVRNAAGAYLLGENADALPLGAFHADELRIAALRMLTLLEPEDATFEQRVVLTQEAQAEHVVAALEALDVAALHGEARQRVLAAACGVIAQQRDSGDEEVTRVLLDATEPSAQLAALVFGTDPALLAPDTQVSYCQAAQRLESATHARLNAGLVAFAGSNPRNTAYWVDGDEYALTDVRASELASALSWSGTKARNAVETARCMSNELACVAEAAANGAVQASTLHAITDGARLLTASIDDAIEQARVDLRSDSDSAEDISDRLWELTAARQELVQQFDAAVSAFAPTHTLAETKRKVRDTLAKLDPEGFEARRAQAKVQQSGIELRPLPDAMAMLTAVMPAEHANACFRAIDAVARDGERADLTSPIGVRRSDALLALCVHDRGGAESDHATGGPSAHVDLVMTLDAFLGIADTAAECVGAGPIPASAAREFLASAATVSVRRVLVDPDTGHALDVGAKRYALTAAERDYIFARDRRCRMPGCNQPAHKCECDHATPFEEGGSTATDNLGALCLRHHQEKTHGGWTIEDSRADGTCTFVSPLGRRYVHEPEPLLPWTLPD